MAELKYQIEGDPQKAIVALSKLNAKQEETIQKLKDTNRAGKDVNRTVDGMAGSIASYVSAGAGIAVVASALRNQENIADRAAQRIGGMADALKRLIQIANSSEESKALQGLADSISRDSGLPAPQALDLVRTAASSGFTQQETRTLSRVALFEPDPVRFVEAADSIADAFQNAPGGSEGIASVALRMLKEKKHGSATEVMQGAAANADIIKALGGDFATAAAMETALAGERDPQQARAQVRGVMAKMLMDAQGRFKDGAPPIEDFKRLAEMTDDELSSTFGEREKANVVLGRDLLVKMLPEIERLANEARSAAMASGTKFSELAIKEAMVQRDPRLRAVLDSQRAKEGIAIAEQGMGVEELRADAVNAVIAARLRDRHKGLLRMPLRWFGEAVYQKYDEANYSGEDLARIASRDPLVTGRHMSRGDAAEFEKGILRDAKVDVLIEESKQGNALMRQQNTMMQQLQNVRFVGATRPSLNTGIE